jgi:polyferredoxin
MDKVGKPHGLIRYATENALAGNWSTAQVKKRLLRPRVIGYGLVFLTIAGGLSASLLLRTPLKLDVIRDRGAMGREVEDGMIENVYRLQIMNTAERHHYYRIEVDGIASSSIADEDLVGLEGASTRAVPVRVRVKPGKAGSGSHPIRFTVSAQDDPSLRVSEKAVFIVPK